MRPRSTSPWLKTPSQTVFCFGAVVCADPAMGSSSIPTTRIWSFGPEGIPVHSNRFRGLSAARDRRILSEGQAQDRLYLAGVVPLRRDLSEAGVELVHLRRRKPGMVKGIQRFGAYLDITAFFI